MKGLAAARAVRGLSQKQLAEKLGLHEMTVSTYERGKSEPNIEMINKIADELNVSTDILFGRKKIKLD